MAASLTNKYSLSILRRDRAGIMSQPPASKTSPPRDPATRLNFGFNPTILPHGESFDKEVFPMSARIFLRMSCSQDRGAGLILSMLLLFQSMAHGGQSLPPQPSLGTHGQEPAPLNLTLQEALDHARQNSVQLQSARINSLLAHEDRQQVRAGFLPSLNYQNQYIYTQGNGTPSGVFISNDGVHVYNSQAVIHQELYSPSRRAEYHQASLAEAVAQARVEIAARGLVATVVQAYYSMVVNSRRLVNSQQGVEEARRFADITQKQEKGGEVARSDVVKAQILLQQRERDAQDAQFALEKARLNLAVLLFPDFRQDFTVVDDLQSASPLAAFEEIRTLAAKQNPDLRAAELTLQHEKTGIGVARAAYMPSLTFDYFFGINANQFATRSEGIQRLGSSAQATLNIPVWNWGATRSKVRQAELRAQLAQHELSLTQRELLANLHSFYQEAHIAQIQMDSLKQSVTYAQESMRLTLLRYEAGEATVLEVVDAQTTLTQARNARDDGLARYRLSLANLQTLTGVF
jgi:outer membrane protein TolC